MSSTVTTFFSLPGSAELLPSLCPEHLIDVLGDCFMLAIPRARGWAVDGAVGVAAEANGAAGEGGGVLSLVGGSGPFSRSGLIGG
jgi:hypothetical protein